MQLQFALKRELQLGARYDCARLILHGADQLSGRSDLSRNSKRQNSPEHP
jgi:hypothetical protein